jgi:transposase
MLYTGLDIHKKTIYATMMDREGKIIDQKEFPNCKEKLELFLCGRPTKIVIEACGFWMDTYDKLKEMGYEVVLAHPGKVEAIASAKMKTDKIDSEILAHLLRSNLIPEAWAPDKEVREKRDLVRFRSYLIRNRSRYKSKIKFVLLKKGLKYPQSIWKGRWRKAIEHLDPKIAAYFRIIDKINEEVKLVDRQISELNKNNKEVELLKTIYGINDYAAITIMAEIGDIKRFPTVKKLKSYSGLVPSIYQSGEKLRTGHITRQGSR